MGRFSLPIPSFREAVAAAWGSSGPRTPRTCLPCVTGVQSWQQLQAGSWLWSGEGICSIPGCVKQPFPCFSEKRGEGELRPCWPGLCSPQGRDSTTLPWQRLPQGPSGAALPWCTCWPSLNHSWDLTRTPRASAIPILYVLVGFHRTKPETETMYSSHIVRPCGRACHTSQDFLQSPFENSQLVPWLLQQTSPHAEKSPLFTPSHCSPAHSALLFCLFCVYARPGLASHSTHATYRPAKLHLSNSKPFPVRWSLQTFNINWLSSKLPNFDKRLPKKGCNSPSSHLKHQSHGEKKAKISTAAPKLPFSSIAHCKVTVIHSPPSPPSFRLAETRFSFRGRQCNSLANHNVLLQPYFEDLKGAKGLMLAFQMWTNLTHCT